MAEWSVWDQCTEVAYFAKSRQTGGGQTFYSLECIYGNESTYWPLT